MASTKSPRTRDLADLFIGIGSVLLILFIASFARVRADLTSEGRYTLTPATVSMLDKLPDVVFVKVYLTGDLPADLRHLSRSTRDMLDEMRVHNPDRLQYEFVDPNAEPDEKARVDGYAQLQKAGLQYTSVRTRGNGARGELIVWPAALIEYRGRTIPVQLLKNQVREADADMVNGSINNLEYEISSAINNITADFRPKVAFLQGHGEPGDMRINDIVNALSEQYDVTKVRLDGRLEVLSTGMDQAAFRQNNFDALVVVKPDSAFTQKDAYLIDQFLMNGGRILWVVDVMNAHLDSLRAKQFSIATPLELGIDELLFAQGVRINKDLLVDRQCALIGVYTRPYGDQQKLEYLPFPFEPVVIPRSNHPIVSNIDPVHLRFVSSIDTIATDSLTHTILLTSSPYTRAMRNPVRISLAMADMDLKLDRNSSPERPVAVLVEGKFRSAFADRLVMADTSLKAIGHREDGRRSAVMVVSDGDAIINAVDPAKSMYYTLGYDRNRRAKMYGNREFFINAMNYLLKDGDLIATRSRVITLRKLDETRVETGRTGLQVANVALPILLSVAAGAAFAYLRRRRYTRTENA